MHVQHEAILTHSLSTYLFCISLLSEVITSTADIDRLMGYDKDQQKRSAALLLLKLKEKRRISQVAVDDIIEHTKAQFELAEVRSCLATKGVDLSELDLDLALRLSGINHPFSELDTKHKQENYYVDKLGLIVS